ncbi:10252_t:CDS:2 [Diversispora eburnea]|uniref:10252_t:CDS:1 n=1 Tax=Diversispora eburnea TaxID=1213867 RepID=A0A9N8ZCC2_9GLOM|nr:10252_t:CDS:2 [Diversispora eburnea]
MTERKRNSNWGARDFSMSSTVDADIFYIDSINLEIIRFKYEWVLAQNPSIGSDTTE